MTHDALIHVERNVYANEAGLKWLAELRARPKDPHANTRCLWADFQCPFLRAGQSEPCRQPRRNRHLLVKIGAWYWKPEKRPIGQMSIFEPHRTHKQVWVNTRTGREQDEHPDPQLVMISCKSVALAQTKWLETREGWKPPAWRIIPLTDTKADLDWKESMIAKHGLRACVFDTI